jgi:hypothetical protein
VSFGKVLRIRSPSGRARGASSDAGLSRAVDDALRETVSDQEAARIYLAAAEEAKGTVALAQAVVSWLASNKPELARRVVPASLHAYQRIAS